MAFSASDRLGSMDTTPIEPVIVQGCATMALQPTEIQYPPEPATLPIEATTGFLAAFRRWIAPQIMSLASALPPGLFTRSTTALTLSSLQAASSASTIVSLPMDVTLPSKPALLLPLVMMPVAYTIATYGSLGASFLGGFSSLGISAKAAKGLPNIFSRSSALGWP